MANRAKRYGGEERLNVKKLIAVIVLIIVVIMFILGIKTLLEEHSDSTTGKIETLTYYTIYDNGKWGVINSKGEKVIPLNYSDMIVIPDNTKAAFICTYDVDYSKGTYKTKVINDKEEIIIEGYEKIEPILNYDNDLNIWYESGVLKAEKDGKYGLVDFTGKVLLDCIYDDISVVQGIENSILLLKDGKYGICDNSGSIIIETKYNKIKRIEDNYKNGYIVVDENSKYGIIGIDKSVILECNYEDVKGIYSSTLYVVKSDGKYKVINKEGETVLQDKFDDAIDINGDYIIAKKSGKVGVIDINGETKIEFKYDDLTAISSNNFIAKNGEKYGVISIDGTEKIPFEYINIKFNSLGDFIIANLIENEKEVSKIFDSNFELKITGTVLEVNNTKGYISIYANDNHKYYNFKFEEKENTSLLAGNNLFLSKKDGKYGFVDKEGNVVVDYIYDDGTEQNSCGYAGIKKDGLWGSVDAKGNVSVEPKYNLDNNTKIDFIGSWHLCADANANYYLKEN